MPSAADAYDKEANALDEVVTKVRDLIVCGIGSQSFNQGTSSKLARRQVNRQRRQPGLVRVVTSSVVGGTCRSEGPPELP